eukprot:14529952-Ditylum_brightwellii.AAC.1
MVTTKVQDDKLAQIGWMASNFVWCLGYVPNSYRGGLDLLIHKNPINHHVHRLRPILLFNIVANMHIKRLG